MPVEDFEMGREAFRRQGEWLSADNVVTLVREEEKCLGHSWEGQQLGLTLNHWEKGEDWLSGWMALLLHRELLEGDTILISKDRALFKSAHFKGKCSLRDW